MHKARAFFFVCAGIFLLAVVYHLGARSAGAQAAGSVESAISQGVIVAVVDHRLYVKDGASVTVSPYVIPGVSRAVGVGSSYESNGIAVVLENGDVYGTVLTIGGDAGTSGPWSWQGNLLGASVPTPAQSISIGQLKAKYAK